MDFYIDVPNDVYEKVMKFNLSLGIFFWNIAVMTAPYDTGNLRRSITLARNTNKKIDIQYDLLRANYLRFLEEGIGPVTKHYHFIEDKTRLAITEQLIMFLKTGKQPLYMNYPYVELRNSKSVFQSERKFLKGANAQTSVITPNVRRKISMIRETNYRKANNLGMSSFKGQKVVTVTQKRQALKSSNNGMSVLQQVYLEAKGA